MSTPVRTVTPVVEKLVSSSSVEGMSPSTVRRKHFPLTSASSVLDIPEQDNAADRKQRRHSKVFELQRRLQSPGPCTPSERRRSLPLSSLNNAQITEHYTNCIKLYTENKINSKNAFALQLIDHMSEVLKSQAGEMTNFQVASCTIDASAKIYAGRVDAIHADTYKMLGGLGHGERQNKEGGAEDADPRDDDEIPGRKKKKRVRNTVEKNLKNINVNKFDLGFEVDPLFQKTSASFDEGGTFGLLMNHLRCLDDGSELLLDSNTVIQEKLEAEECQTETKMIDLTDILSLSGGLTMEGLQICPHFENFEFTNWKKDENDTSTFSEIRSKMSSNDHAFDINAVPEPIDMPEPMNDTMGIDHYDGGNMSDDDVGAEGLGSAGGDTTMFMSDGQVARMVSGRSASSALSSGTVGELCLQLSSNPSEYSYFDPAVLDMWAGPTHWKVKPRPKDEGKKTKSKKVIFRIDFSEEIDLDKKFAETRAGTTLSKATLLKHSNSSFILPDDVHFDLLDLFKLSIKPEFSVQRLQVSSDQGVDDGIESYDYNNDNDCANFCPTTDAVNDGDDDDDFSNNFSALGSDMTMNTFASQEGGSFGNESVFDTTTLQGDKLVAQPKKVNKIDIAYARTAKRMDVKKLKSIMWNYLTTPGESDKENQEVIDEPKEPTGVHGTQTFNDMYETLPGKLSTTLSKNLSIPIAFVCLLHLANEKCLRVDGCDNMDDLRITQDGV